MKTLYIVRHAKSSWDEPFLDDHDRPLANIGVKKTKRIIKYLQSKQEVPELMISSSAVRALETARLIADGIGYPLDQITIEPNLYHASSETIFNELYGLPDSLKSVMIFGHNPTLTYFVNKFIQPPIVNLPTTGLVSVSFQTDHWEKIDMVDFKVNFVVTPRMLK